MKNKIGLFTREIRIHEGYKDPHKTEDSSMCIAFILSANSRSITWRLDLMHFFKVRTNHLHQMEKAGIYIVDVCSHSNNPDEGSCKVSPDSCPYIEGECYSLQQTGSGIKALGILQSLGEDGLWDYLEEKFYFFFNITSPKSKQIATTDKYWDCECLVNYIHRVHNDYCATCQTYKKDAPSSRVNEVAIVTGQTEKEVKEEK